jgi:hypothetical protein
LYEIFTFVLILVTTIAPCCFPLEAIAEDGIFPSRYLVLQPSATHGAVSHRVFDGSSVFDEVDVRGVMACVAPRGRGEGAGRLCRARSPPRAAARPLVQATTAVLAHTTQ